MDNARRAVGGQKVLEAFLSECPEKFDCPCVIVGEDTSAPAVAAAGDLTVTGNFAVFGECEIEGTLTVLGDAKIGMLNCGGSLICRGTFTAREAYVGGNITAKSMCCEELECGGTVLLLEDAEIAGAADVGGTLFAGAALFGEGSVNAARAVAGGYIDIRGSLAADTVKLKDSSAPIVCDGAVSFETAAGVIAEAARILEEKYNEPNLAQQTLNYLNKLGEIQSTGFKILPALYPSLINIGAILESGDIKDAGSYLALLAAQKLLGAGQIDTAKKSADNLNYKPGSIEQLSRALSIAVMLKADLKENYGAYIEKILAVTGADFKKITELF